MRPSEIIFLAILTLSPIRAATICSCAEIAGPDFGPVVAVGGGNFPYSNSEYLTAFGDYNSSAYLLHISGQPTQINIITKTWTFSRLQLFGRSSDTQPWIEIPLSQIEPDEFTPPSPQELWVEYESPASGANQFYLAADYTNGERELFATIPIASIPEPASICGLVLSAGFLVRRIR